MALIDLACKSCGKIKENVLVKVLPYDENKEFDEVCECGSLLFKRMWLKPMNMNNMIEYEIGGKKDWRKGKSNFQIANIIADDSVPVK